MRIVLAIKTSKNDIVREHSLDEVKKLLTAYMLKYNNVDKAIDALINDIKRSINEL